MSLPIARPYSKLRLLRPVDMFERESRSKRHHGFRKGKGSSHRGCVLRQNIRSNPQGGPFPSLSSASSSSSAESNEGRFQNIPTHTCLEQLCQPASFNHLRECLNCIVANGGEREVTISRPPGVTPQPTPWWPGSTEEERNEWPGEGWDRIEGVEEARGWLRNVTVYCSENGQEVEGVEEEEGEGWGLTATPTTTCVISLHHLTEPPEARGRLGE